MMFSMNFSISDQIILAVALATHAIAIVTAVVAFVGSRRGRYSTALIVCAWVPVCYAILTCVGTVYDFNNDKDDFCVDMLIYVPLGLLVCVVGLANLVRLRENKQRGRLQAIS